MIRKIEIRYGIGYEDKYTSDGKHLFSAANSFKKEEEISISDFDQFWNKLISFDSHKLNEQIKDFVFSIKDGWLFTVKLYEDENTLLSFITRPCEYFREEKKEKYKELFDFSKLIEGNVFLIESVIFQKTYNKRSRIGE